MDHETTIYHYSLCIAFWNRHITSDPIDWPVPYGTKFLYFLNADNQFYWTLLLLWVVEYETLVHPLVLSGLGLYLATNAHGR